MELLGTQNHDTTLQTNPRTTRYIDGLRTLAAKIATMSAEGGPTQDPNYTPGVDFLDHDFS
jgi:hypothetical protein